MIFCFSDMKYDIVQVTLHNALCIVMLMVKSNYLVNLLQPISGQVTVEFCHRDIPAERLQASGTFVNVDNI